jgi:hypothetical protein
MVVPLLADHKMLRVRGREATAVRSAEYPCVEFLRGGYPCQYSPEMEFRASLPISALSRGGRWATPEWPT